MLERPEVRGTFRALRSREYRLFFIGQGISLLGTFLQQTALGWYLYRTTGSTLLLGTLGFVGQIPSVLLTPVAGVLADRVDRRIFLLWIQVLSLLQALALAFLLHGGLATVPVLLALSAVLGALNAFEIPIRQSMVSQLVEDRSLLSNAIALNSALFNAARLLGPMAGGFLVAAMGEALCFSANAASYAAVILALWLMRPKPVRHHDAGDGFLRQIRDGLFHAREHEFLWIPLLLVAATSFLGLSSGVLFPVMAREWLHGDARTLGFLSAATGAGALLAALNLARRSTVVGLLPLLGGAVAGASLALGVMSLQTRLLPVLLCNMIAGFGFITAAGGANTIVQTVVDERFRGRILSLYTLSFLGIGPLGSLWVGFWATRLGSRGALACNAILFFLCALLFAIRIPALRRALRPHYVLLGILPEQDGNGKGTT